MTLYIIIISGALGTIFGSFAGAQVWRLRAEQLAVEKKSGEAINEQELKHLKPLLGKDFTHDRSLCLHCKHTLAWYDMIPVLSWVMLGGKCRYCRAPIGWVELALEITLGGLFALSVALWPLTAMVEWVRLALWLVALVVLAINFVYDARWSLLVSELNWLLIGLGIVFAGITLTTAPNLMLAVWSLVGSLMILGGLYGALWVISRGSWVGEGDIYLGTGLALFLGDWRLAFVALFAANLIGTVIALSAMLAGRLGRKSRIPFGPLLIAGTLVALFAGPTIIEWYETMLF